MELCLCLYPLSCNLFSICSFYSLLCSSLPAALHLIEHILVFYSIFPLICSYSSLFCIFVVTLEFIMSIYCLSQSIFQIICYYITYYIKLYNSKFPFPFPNPLGHYYDTCYIYMYNK